MESNQEQQEKEFDKQVARLTKIKSLEMLSNSTNNDSQLIPLIIQQNTRLMELLTNLTERIIMNYSVNTK